MPFLMPQEDWYSKRIRTRNRLAKECVYCTNLEEKTTGFMKIIRIVQDGSPID